MIKFKRIPAVVAVFIALTAIIACSPQEPKRKVAVGEIILPDLDGKSIRLKDFNGQVVMLNFWATWCGPCLTEIPDFIELQDEFESEGFTIVGVSMDSDEPGAVKAFSLTHNINYPILYAGEEVERVTDVVGGVRGIPTTFLLDRNGDVVEKIVGLMAKQKWKKAIKKLL